MDWVTLTSKTMDHIKRYRYLFLIILIGILLLRFPDVSSAAKTIPEEHPQPQSSLEDSLSRILCQMDGAGRVEVLLTEAEGEELLYQSDETHTSGQTNQDTRSNTVLISGSDRGESGLIRQRNPPVYQGAVILCQGADQPGIRLAIVEAVTDLTGLTSDKITVLKMK